MPQLGETVTEGTITKWFKAVGDTVARDEPLFEVSTDKVDSEVPSPADGILTAILVEEGDTVDVGVALAVIDGEGAGAAAPAAAPAAPTTEAPAGGPALTALPDEPVPARPPAPATPSPAPAAAPAAPPPAPAAPAAPPPAPATAAAPVVAAAPGAAADGGPADQSMVLSPVVRKLLADHAIDPGTVRGTGLGGRITRGDVEAIIEGASPPAAVPSIPAGSPPPATTSAVAPSPATGGRGQEPGGRD
jgi:pyruvate dehydrogenase E2 component (dihydrolipoamide acetyltransferase)